MNLAAPTLPDPPPTPLAWVAADRPAEARATAEALSRIGVRATAADALDQALAGDLPVAVVCTAAPPRLRGALEWARSRAAAPPAVILVCPTPSASDLEPRVYQAFPEDAPPRALASAVLAAGREWPAFARAWPLAAAGPGQRELAQVAALVEQHRGLAIRADRRRALAEAVGVRLVARLVPTAQAYLRRLASARFRAQELDALTLLLAVNETHFWRHAGQFTALMTEVLPRLRGRPAKIWSAGCASGEEPYSLAIACVEVLGPEAPVEIVATDNHAPSLARARRGRYGQRAVRNIPPEMLRRHLRPRGDGWEVPPHLRRMVRFERRDLLAPDTREWVRRSGPFAAVFCRNTLIYFRPEAVAETVDLLSTSLDSDGALFLGPSETIWPRRPELEPVRSAGCFYYRRVAATPRPRPTPAAAGRVRAGPADDAEAVYRAGLALLDVEEFERAQQRFQSLLEADPTDPRGMVGQALLLANEGREQEALVAARQAAASPSAPAEACYLCGLLQERSGDDAGALVRYDEALLRDPGLVMARVNRAWILLRRGDRAAAAAEAGRALQALRSGLRVPRWMTGGMEARAVAEILESSLQLPERRDEP
ncbi:CheR family methyltransferase [Deferrisoma camini]|uniref:CheR family methyltransferase n=1 Tax=Deferrisoma camini TaxID=1035120 RepID=UPI00046D178E|nr:CheR family methyltransferase [Deferrisoma camini]